jgi:hypothetical protein
MKNKIIGIGMCLLLLATAIPAVGSLDTAPASTTLSRLSELKKAFIIGRYSNLTGEGGYITIETVNIFVIYKEPFSFGHFPRGTHLQFEMYNAFGRIFKNINFLYLHVELVV